MRILHTSDWHLGKNLEGFSRLEEQEKFLKDFIKIVEENNVDMVIIAGDIYDNGNPPSKAESLFYNTLKSICNDGKRAVLIVAGNHDNPERLVAASPLAYEQGIIMLGTPKSVVPKGKCGKFQIVDSGEGYLELEINGEKSVIITLPYPSEKRLNEILTESLEDDNERRKSYSDRLKELFSNLEKKYRQDTINIAVSHIFISGSEASDSERPIELGGSLAVDSKSLPQSVQYFALGHLHKPQKASGTSSNVFYSGSPLPYSKSEVGYSKGCKLIEVSAGKEPKIEDIYFKNYKPIEVWKCKNINEAIEKCREEGNREVWVYIEIKTDKFISQEDIKTMKELKKDIIEIVPKIDGVNEEDEILDNAKEKTMKELFYDFYVNQRGVEPSQEIMDLLLDIACSEEGEAIETNES